MPKVSSVLYDYYGEMLSLSEIARREGLPTDTVLTRRSKKPGHDWREYMKPVKKLPQGSRRNKGNDEWKALGSTVRTENLKPLTISKWERENAPDLSGYKHVMKKDMVEDENERVSEIHHRIVDHKVARMFR